jgi:hypothetical protein
MRIRAIPIGLIAIFYVLAWIPYITLTKAASTVVESAAGEPLRGLQILPAFLIFFTVANYIFIWASGWWKLTNRIQFLGLTIPAPSRFTLIAGFGAAALMVTVPLSFTFVGVSIPFMQLLMRGDVLLVAPLIDRIVGRRVRWYSWTALALVAAGMGVALIGRGGLNIPGAAMITVLVYTAGYFLRLMIMSKVAKSGGESGLRRYYAEEQLVSGPIGIVVLGSIALSANSSQAADLAWGFTRIWPSSGLFMIALMAICTVVIGILAGIILMDDRENSFSVPLERSASVLGGLAASVMLWATLGLPLPTSGEWIGAGFLVVAIILLGLGPRLRSRRAKI